MATMFHVSLPRRADPFSALFAQLLQAHIHLLTSRGKIVFCQGLVNCQRSANTDNDAGEGQGQHEFIP